MLTLEKRELLELVDAKKWKMWGGGCGWIHCGAIARRREG
jgi:hypothetical protein